MINLVRAVSGLEFDPISLLGKASWLNTTKCLA